jgi:16S rRNA (cytosine967-C5)-methyltransferase
MVEYSTTHALFASPRGTVIKILSIEERSDFTLEKLLEDEMENSLLSFTEKKFVYHCVQNVLRWQGYADWILYGFCHTNLGKADVFVRSALHLALCELLILNEHPAEEIYNVTEEFIIRLRGEKSALAVRELLLHIVSQQQYLRSFESTKDPVRQLSVTHSFPLWMVKRWFDRFGFDQTAKLLEAYNNKSELSLRVHKNNISVAEFCSLLTEQNISFTLSRFNDTTVVIKNHSTKNEIAGLQDIEKKNFFITHRESNVLALQLFSARPNEKILLCGQTSPASVSFLFETMQGTGEIIILEEFTARRNHLQKECSELKITNVAFVEFASLNEQKILFDKVFYSAPSSELGLLRTKPELKWNNEIETIHAYAKEQKKQLKLLLSFVKPNGILLYATNTIEYEENYLVVRSLLDSHADCILENAAQYVPRDVVSPELCIETYPHRHQLDGGFAARILKLSH